MRAWILALLLGLGAIPGQGKDLVIGLQPMGSFDTGLCQMLQADLEDHLACTVLVLDRRSLPTIACHPPRKRYRADRLLIDLEGVRIPQVDKVVGLVREDISVPKDPYPDWGIFGLGQLGGRSCVVSTHRLGARRAGLDRRLERLRRVVRHEVLHTLGLEHCPQRGCLMEDAEGTMDAVDRGEGLPCPACRGRLDGLWP